MAAMKAQSEVQVFRTLTSVLAPSVNIAINPRPKWLTNPKTGKVMELDFVLSTSPAIAIEVQGPHHFSDPAQIERDELKKYLCEKKGVKLVCIGILDNNPNFFYNLFSKMNGEGFKIAMREPSYLWAVRRSWGKKYNKSIKAIHGKQNPCYTNPDKYFEKYDPKQFWVLKPGGIKEYL